MPPQVLKKDLNLSPFFILSWANHCHFDHDDAVRSVRCNKSPFDTVGQNIGMWTGFMPASYLSLVDFW